MNAHEIERIAAAMNSLRPDWPASSIRTFINKNLTDKPRRDVAVVLTWIACEPNSATPARALENGPWWKAVATDHGHQHKPFDPRTICSTCSKTASTCTANPHNNHDFESVHARNQRIASEQAARKTKSTREDGDA